MWSKRGATPGPPLLRQRCEIAAREITADAPHHLIEYSHPNPPSRALAPSSSSIPLAGLLQRLPRIAPGASQPSTKAALAPRTPSPLPRGVHTGSNIRAGSHKQPSLSKTA
ncbi:hypothetical protein Anapl_01763 [Anas platyrhynchos]|uniref:Uncharacterized protein n=1 Tax=Anas platyrhynchos TaxID=8839 RepID=R0K148_ANAPL|nr:hypothetical protein Anapl_01763 [Anas platyrhynchos]